MLGASWLIGSLEALEAEAGWSPADAELIVGTSAGSVVGALTAAGIPPAYMSAYSSGKGLDEIGEGESRAEELAERAAGLAEGAAGASAEASGSAYRLHPALPPIGPGSWRMALGTLAHPLRHSAAALLGGWLPRGFVSTKPIRDLVGTFVEEWPADPRLWVVAADYATGRRTVFGRDDAPPANVADAVAASCAIPGFYHPVEIGGRRFVDGGVCSTSNLDLLAGRSDLDLVVCLNPTSSRASVPVRGPGGAVGALMRAQSGRRLGHEARKLRDKGTEVLLLQPTLRDIEVMGTNLMSRSRRAEVAERAVKTTAVELRRLRAKGAVLPGRAARKPVRPAAGRRRRAA